MSGVFEFCWHWTGRVQAARGGFFLAVDKVQVKYEMLRAHLVDGINVTDAAAVATMVRAAAL